MLLEQYANIYRNIYGFLQIELTSGGRFRAPHNVAVATLLAFRLLPTSSSWTPVNSQTAKEVG